MSQDSGFGNYNFTGQGGDRAHEQNVDIDADSPHHTLGKGRTQAAAGNHTHDASEISGLAKPGDPITDHQQLGNRNATDAHPQYSKTDHSHAIITDHQNLSGLEVDSHAAYPTKTGGRASGTWPINVTGNAGSANSANSAGNAGTVNGLKVSWGVSVEWTLAGGAAGGNFVLNHNLGKTPAMIVANAIDDNGSQSIAVAITSWNASTVTCGARNLNANTAETFRIGCIAVG